LSIILITKFVSWTPLVANTINFVRENEGFLTTILLFQQ